MQRNFCYRCGAKLEQKSEYIWYCPEEDFTQYENQKPCVEIALLHEQKLLISKRGIDPFKGKYDLPGGFVDMSETAEQALLREIHEELGLHPGDITTPEYLMTYSSVYPFGPEIYQNIIIVYVAVLKCTPEVIIANDDVASVRWISKDGVSGIKWSHTGYEQIFTSALKKNL